MLMSGRESSISDASIYLLTSWSGLGCSSAISSFCMLWLLILVGSEGRTFEAMGVIAPTKKGEFLTFALKSSTQNTKSEPGLNSKTLDPITSYSRLLVNGASCLGLIS